MSPLKFLTSTKWHALCEKYKINPNYKPKKLGSGISAIAYTFGGQLVIKYTDCNSTVNVARKIKNKNLDFVAKVYELGPVKYINEWGNQNDGYYIIQERVQKRSNTKVDEFCDYFENLASAMSNFDNQKNLKSFIDIAFKLKRCGIDLSEISDLHAQNVFATAKGKIKIIDLGCLQFEN